MHEYDKFSVIGSMPSSYTAPAICVLHKVMSSLLVKRFPFLIVTITRTSCVCVYARVRA